jgi:hypothetical protein
VLSNKIYENSCRWNKLSKLDLFKMISCCLLLSWIAFTCSLMHQMARIYACVCPKLSAVQSREAGPIDTTYALLFDCDGVIAETEELHRTAYNKAFEKYGLVIANGQPVIWDPDYCEILDFPSSASMFVSQMTACKTLWVGENRR